MKKIISLTCGVALCSCLVSMAFAADYTVDGTTGQVTISAANVPAANGNLIFNPSAQVEMSGASEASAFAHGAFHRAVENKAAGKQFGMASDSSAVYFLDISADGVGAAVDVTGQTNAAGLLGTSAGNWHTI